MDSPVVDEPTTKLAALTSGELDFAGINPAHAEYVRRDPRLAVIEYPLLFTYALVFNLRRPPFDRLAAREAVAGAVEETRTRYEGSVRTVSNALNVVLEKEEVDYLDLRFNILGIMEDFVGRHQELLNLVSVKRRDLVTFVHLLNVTLL